MDSKGKYDDIINLPHHVSSTRPPMPRSARAAQFSPFAALRGYDEAIEEVERLTERRIELSEDEKYVLDRKQQFLANYVEENPELTITYFEPDKRKAGGAYLTLTGKIKKIDEYSRVIVMMDGSKIPLDEVMGIECELFPDNI